MVRPCFIVVDPEHSGSISTRKLVIESAKLNVITAYSGSEAIETVKRFPAADGVVCNTQLHDIPAARLIQAIKQINPELPVIVVGPTDEAPVRADYYVPSFDPRSLLEALQSLRPSKIEAIIRREDELRDVESDN